MAVYRIYKCGRGAHNITFRVAVWRPVIMLYVFGVLLDNVVCKLSVCIFLATQDTEGISPMVPNCQLFCNVFFEIWSWELFLQACSRSEFCKKKKAVHFVQCTFRYTPFFLIWFIQLDLVLSYWQLPRLFVNFCVLKANDEPGPVTDIETFKVFPSCFLIVCKMLLLLFPIPFL